MKCIEKIGGNETFYSFLKSKGFKEAAIRMMISRRKISNNAIVLIISEFRKIRFEPSDFKGK
ncbi:MAG: hypothetical protein LBU87_01980 [Lactobacillales bacterium]|nr:hypothetical protein [Lactobacillales bacterium]